MVVNAILYHWVTEVVREEAGPDGFRRAASQMVTFFYMDDSLLASTRVDHLQQVFNVSTDLFDQVGLEMNIGKMIIIVSQPCQLVGGHLAEAYKKHMVGVGMPYHAFRCQHVQCPECNA